MMNNDEYDKTVIGLGFARNTYAVNRKTCLSWNKKKRTWTSTLHSPLSTLPGLRRLTFHPDLCVLSDMHKHRLSLGILFALISLLLLFVVAQRYPQQQSQSVLFVVSATPETDIEEVTVEVRHAGRTSTLALDPCPSEKTSEWRSEWKTGAPFVLLPLRILVTRKGSDIVEEAGVFTEPLHSGLNRVACVLEPEKNGAYKAFRTSVAGTAQQVIQSEVYRVVAKAAAAIAVLLFVLWSASRFSKSSAGLTATDVRTGRGEHLTMTGIDIVIWLLLAAAWTWPAIQAGDHVLVGRHYDTMGTAWVIDATPRILQGFEDAMTAWPVSADYRRLDSFMLLLFSLLFRGLGAARAHGLFQIIGVATSAWAVQGFARAAGARRPFDMISGLSFAFSGLAAHAILEGHIYHVMSPWLPLFAWVWLRSLSTSSPWRMGLLAGALFCLSMLTSAYQGLAATVVAAGFLMGFSLKKRAFPWKPTLAVVAVVLPIATMLMYMYRGGGELSRDMTAETAHHASAHLMSMLGATPEQDRVFHSLALELSPVMLALLIVAPVVLRKLRPYRTLMWTASAGLLLAIGPSFAAGDNHVLFRTPLALLMDTPFEVLLRFPIRFAWILNLCAGTLAAIVATALSARRPRTACILLLLALLHPFVGIRLPARQRSLTWETPTAYAADTGPVLDLFPVQAWPPQFDEIWFHILACTYQMDHKRPIAANGVDTSPESLPQLRLGQWATRNLLTGKAEDVKTALSSLGFRTLVFHADYYLPDERSKLDSALRQFETSRRESVNGGLHVIAQSVPPPATELTQKHRSEFYETLVADRSKELFVETLHASPPRVYSTQNDWVAMAGVLAYLAIAAAWLLRQAGGIRQAASAKAC
jgi:hypothetical protein